MRVDRPGHVVAIFGGACSGSVAADVLAARGVQVVVFEQNPRPYGKIEDGLPRWHKNQREMEYRKIDQRLTKPGITFVPNTRLGVDVDFEDVARWGWSAVLLANGAWKDRPLDLPGAEDVVDRGLVYQNAFVYWFNHCNERAYTGPRYEVPPGAVCIGGGLASIDVIKIFQLELYGRALKARGLHVSMYELEHKGIPKACQELGVDPASLGVVDSTLVYRRRVEDMPLASTPDNADDVQRKKAEVVRQKILSKAQEKFRFHMKSLTTPVGLIIEDGRLRGVRLVSNTMASGSPRPIPGSEHEIRTDLVVSSIGSIPEPIRGIRMRGALYDADTETGEYTPVPGVFGVGNVVTGKGNIAASVMHGKLVATNLIERYLGVDEAGETASDSDLLKGLESLGSRAAAAVQTYLSKLAPLSAEAANALLGRAEARQKAIGYDGDYTDWIRKVTPPDLE